MASIEAGVGLDSELGTLTLREVVRVPAWASLRETATKLREADVSVALVGDSDHDIVTERDLTRALAEGWGPQAPVDAFEEPTPIWATTNNRVIEAAEMMLHHEVQHLIVLGIDGRAAGVISLQDIFSMLLPNPPSGTSWDASS